MKKKIGIILISIILLFAISTLTLRLFGFQTHVVISDSMHPAIPKYSFVYIKKYSLQEAMDKVDRNDVIAVDVGDDIPLMHRVVDKDVTANIIVMHGDHNEEDVRETVSYEQVIGEMVFFIPWIGILFSSIYIWIIIALVIFILFTLQYLIKELKKR